MRKHTNNKNSTIFLDIFYNFYKIFEDSLVVVRRSYEQFLTFHICSIQFFQGLKIITQHCSLYGKNSILPFMWNSYSFRVITFWVITFCVGRFITFCFNKLLHFAVKLFLHFALILLHFAANVITFCSDLYWCCLL